jgi:putative aminopeptidase FrvX
MRKLMAAADLLEALLSAAGPSGHEDAAAAIWREAASSFAEVTSDTLGTSFARVRTEEGAATLAVVGHIDEIGVIVTNVEDGGLLSFTTIGGISPEALSGQRVRVLARGGIVTGTIGRRRLTAAELRDRPRLEHADLHLDIGASSREQAEELVSVGDAGVWIGDPVSLPGNRLLSKSLDNRLGAYVALEAARRVAEAGTAEVDVVAVAAVQEEIGLYGARAASFGLEPQVALAVDVTPSTDVPGGDPRRGGRIDIGQGAMIARGPTLNRRVTDLLADVARREEIAHHFEVYSQTTSTDADEIHLARAGVPTGLISIPTRYLHSPNELCSLDDVESAVRLVAAFALALTRDQVFLH